IAGHDPRDPVSADRPVPDLLAGIDRGARHLRVGVPTDHVWEECDPAIAAAVRTAIEALAHAGAEIREIRWPRAADYAKAASPIPCGMDGDGLPIGLQFAARMWDEAAALRAARAYELVRGPFPLPSLDG